jgi:very-short-patch-repair endonuclease
VRSGGVLTGISALHELGAWVLDSPRRIHVAVPAHCASAPRNAGVVVHWEDPTAVSARPGIASIGDALVRVALDEPVDVAVPCFDWAITTNRLDRVDLERTLLRIPDGAWFGSVIDPRSQSVLESVARVRLLARGWKVRSQVAVGVSGAIDLVVEDQVGLELDGREFHEATFERDRRKDLAIAIEGRHAIRISRPMLRDAWPDVERAIESALAARWLGVAGNSGELAFRRHRKLRSRGTTAQLSSVSRDARAE